MQPYKIQRVIGFSMQPINQKQTNCIPGVYRIPYLDLIEDFNMSEKTFLSCYTCATTDVDTHNTVQLSCSCLIWFCQECARKQLQSHVHTYHGELYCPKCENSTPMDQTFIQGVEEALKAELVLIRRGFAAVNVEHSVMGYVTNEVKLSGCIMKLEREFKAQGTSGINRLATARRLFHENTPDNDETENLTAASTSLVSLEHRRKSQSSVNQELLSSAILRYNLSVLVVEFFYNETFHLPWDKISFQHNPLLERLIAAHNFQESVSAAIRAHKTKPSRASLRAPTGATLGLTAAAAATASSSSSSSSVLTPTRAAASATAHNDDNFDDVKTCAILGNTIRTGCSVFASCGCSNYSCSSCILRSVALSRTQSFVTGCVSCPYCRKQSIRLVNAEYVQRMQDALVESALLYFKPKLLKRDALLPSDKASPAETYKVVIKLFMVFGYSGYVQPFHESKCAEFSAFVSSSSSSSSVNGGNVGTGATNTATLLAAAELSWQENLQKVLDSMPIPRLQMEVALLEEKRLNDLGVLATLQQQKKTSSDNRSETDELYCEEMASSFLSHLQCKTNPFVEYALEEHQLVAAAAAVSASKSKKDASSSDVRGIAQKASIGTSEASATSLKGDLVSKVSQFNIEKSYKRQINAFQKLLVLSMIHGTVAQKAGNSIDIESARAAGFTAVEVRDFFISFVLDPANKIGLVFGPKAEFDFFTKWLFVRITVEAVHQSLTALCEICKSAFTNTSKSKESQRGGKLRHFPFITATFLPSATSKVSFIQI
jgi:hypothetical protein